MTETHDRSASEAVSSAKGPVLRCAWPRTDLDIAYHDAEWGVPVHDDHVLFEFLTLEGAQAGLSWTTVLKKREHYRRAFAGFDPADVARFTRTRIERILADPGVVRHRGKIESTVSNANAFLAVQDELGSFDRYVWQFIGGAPRVNHRRALGEIPSSTPESDELSKDLKRRGFRFVGSTICYAFMQAVGMVNDHVVDCFRHKELVEASSASARGMKRRATRSLGRALRALAIAAPMLACSGRDLRHSDSALPAVSPAVDSPAADVLTATLPPAVSLSCAVTDSSIGPIRLGMTFAEAKQALPAAAFEHDSDAEGAVLVGVTVGGDALMALFAEDDEEGPIDWEKRISGMETFSPRCGTTGGVHPGSLVLDAEKVLGKTRKIILSEIESRQFIEFERQRPAMTFRLDYTGIFAEGSRETQRFEPEGRIFSVALWAH